MPKMTVEECRKRLTIHRPNTAGQPHRIIATGIRCKLWIRGNRVRIRFRASDAAGTIIGQTIRLATTRPNYGGLNWWLVCPGCRVRRRRLFLRGDALRCRDCHVLGYRSSREAHKHERLGRQLAKVGGIQNASDALLAKLLRLAAENGMFP